MKKLFVLVGIILIIASLYFTNITGYIISKETNEFLVTRVIDGDTVVLEDDERVRLLGIDTPERGQYFYQDATDYLVERIENKKVRLVSGHEDRDKYDRLLRYIYLDNILVNTELIEKGLATAYIFEEDEYTEIIYQKEAEARRSNIGIWSLEIEDVFCIGIHYFHYNAKGNDNENLNDEYITFRNKCTYPVEITGWELQDTAENKYVFGEIILDAKTKITLHTGSGKDSSEDVYWGKSRAVWNNNGDGIVIFDSDDNRMIEYSY